VNNHVLLVEDNPTDEKLTLRAFRQCGVPADMAVVRDGSEALDYLLRANQYTGRDQTGDPALILLDLSIPKVNGHEVLRRLRADERTKLIPVVILTSSREDEDVIRSYSLGANAYVRKPVAFAEFAEAAKTIALFWLRLNERAPGRIPGLNP
jgi:two-component system, response regulator